MLGGITVTDGERFLPIFPVAISDLQRDRGADGDAMTDAGEDVGGVGFDFHAAAAAVSLLASPEFAVEERLTISGRRGRRRGRR